MKKTLVLVVGVVVAAVVGWAVYVRIAPPMRNETGVVGEKGDVRRDASKFIDPKKTPHYESNVPEQGAVLAGVPVNVVVNFNFDLGKASKISIASGGNEYGFGETVIDENNLGMRRKMAANAPDGVYTVRYTACWPDGSCHDGWFQFEIARGEASKFEDLTAMREVTINMENNSFLPALIRIKKGTKVIWVNLEETGHTINTDPHAGHNYFPAQNSRIMEQGDDFAVTFEEAGIYMYHCSVHAQAMRGQILVE